MNETRAGAIRELADYLAHAGLDFEEIKPGTFVAVLPGEQKLKTTVSMTLGAHAISINAFVIRNPDENHPAIHRWLLERNGRLFGIAYAVDHLGDIYLVGRLPLATVTHDDLDRLMGAILENSDGAFNRLLEMGFESAIRREWKWRLDRGEPTANLSAFAHLAEPEAGTRHPQ